MRKKNSVVFVVFGLAVLTFGQLASGDVTAIGDLPGGITDSRGLGVSADGTVVVGTSFSANGN